MSTISVSDLKKKAARQWLKAADRDLIVTANGQPVALLLGIGKTSLESTRSLVRSLRALRAQSALLEASAENGATQLPPADIDAEISAVRRARRRK